MDQNKPKGYPLNNNPHVKASQRVSIVGPMIPTSWARKLRIKKGRGEEPYYLALYILADIVYWYVFQRIRATSLREAEPRVQVKASHSERSDASAFIMT